MIAQTLKHAPKTFFNRRSTTLTSFSKITGTWAMPQSDLLFIVAQRVVLKSKKPALFYGFHADNLLQSVVGIA
jgi:hypothetical protein